MNLNSLFLQIALITLLLLFNFGSSPCSLTAQEKLTQLPAQSYLITIHYDLGMHCTGFDLSYCCVLPPYNSILAQVIRTATKSDELPHVLSGDDLKKDNMTLWYEHEKNTFSEGPKLLYWNVPFDVNRNGVLNEPNDSFANAEFMQLFTYGENPLGIKPGNAVKKLTVGLDINIPVDHGPTGKSMSHDILDYTSETGTIVYTLLNDRKSEIAIPLSQAGYWEALGLPMTAFFDGTVENIRLVTEERFKPYQKAVVTLARWKDLNKDGLHSKDEIEPVHHSNGKPALFFGTNPVDTPGCDRCHGTSEANGEEFHLYKEESKFWKNTFPNTTEYYARIKGASISMFEIHDKRSGTKFLERYNPKDKTGAAVTRLGHEPIKCQLCHADNVLGVLTSETDHRTGEKVSALTVAIHLNHLRVRPQPDDQGRPANCQTCHPAHSQSGSLERYPLDLTGKFRGGDIRDYHGGCFIGRDVHSNPKKSVDLKTTSHLNAIGKWLKENVMSDGKGLYCTNCHSLASRLLYKYDKISDALKQNGESLRNKDINQIVTTFQQHEGGLYRALNASDFFDPKVLPEDRVSLTWKDSWNEPYSKVDDAGDYWLAAGEPHCADCHITPFVENPGDKYFPIDQKNKYSLMRYSRGHHEISCQSCHESTHGLYPVRPEGSDPTTYEQAASLNPDGSHGPLKCGACHSVDKEGVPTLLTDEMLNDFPDKEYPNRFEKAVAYAHSAR